MTSHPPAEFGVSAIDHVAYPVRDLNQALEFIARVLGSGQLRDPYVVNGTVAVQQVPVGDAMLSLHQVGNGISLAAPAAVPGSLDICFNWTGPIGSAVDHLRAARVAIIEGPVERLNAKGERGWSVYFRDAELNLFELHSTTLEPQAPASP